MTAGLLSLSLAQACWASSSIRRPAQEEGSKHGSRIENFDKVLKDLYPATDRVEERSFYPLESGGTTLMGLVSRLLGEAPRTDTEGLRTRRYFYLLRDKDRKILRIVHGSAFDGGNGIVDLYVAYTADGVIDQVWSPHLPEKVAKEFSDKNILSQFNGHDANDFQIQRKKISRRKSVRIVPAFLSQAKRPAQSEARSYFEKTLRSLRYNVSFMDVAYFITQHPDLADKGGDEFPENVTITTGRPSSGPEAFVRERASASTNPFESNKLNILQSLEPTEKKN